MSDKRGFHFLVGIAMLWFLWRLYAAGIIFQAVAYMLGPDAVACYCNHGFVVANGPGAIIVAFVIEAIITVGWVVTLTVSGIWDGLVVLGRFVSDGFSAAHAYAKGAQAEAATIGDIAVTPPVASDTRSLTPEQAAIEELSRQMVAIAAKLEAKTDAS